MNDKVLVDTNILVYMETNEYPQKTKPAIDIVEKNASRVTLSIQNVAEFSSVLSRRYKKDPKRLNKKIDLYLDSFYSSPMA